MDNILKRLSYVVEKETGGNYSKFGKLAGIPKGTISHYKNERAPNAEHLTKIHKVFGVDINWLLTGEGDAYSVDKEDAEREDPIKLVGDIIEGLENVLQEEGTDLSPAKKRRLVELLYKRFRQTGENITTEIVRDHLVLIAA